MVASSPGTRFWAAQIALIAPSRGDSRRVCHRVLDFNAETRNRGASNAARIGLRRLHRNGPRFLAPRLAHLQKAQLTEKHTFFGSNTGCLETLKWLRGEGVFSVVDQIDPARVEDDIVRAERERWPGWETNHARIPDAYFERLAGEWELASRVLVNSSWSA